LCWVVGNESYASQHDHNETRGLIISFTDNRLHESDRIVLNVVCPVK
jgi:hypothetical protein